MIDIGLNLASDSFANDRVDIIQRGLDNNVSGFLLTGTSLKSSQQVLALSKQNPDIMRCTSGVHPHDAKNWKAVEHLIEKNIADPFVLSVGECGLDYDRMYSPLTEQKVAFEAQLKLALKYKKPVFLHVRGKIGQEQHVIDDFLTIFEPYHKEGVNGVVHCFTGNEALLNSILDMDLYVGITGWVCDPKRGVELQQLLLKIPDNRLMIETDAPYLTPKNIPKAMFSRRNEPAFLHYVLDKVAELKGQDKQKLDYVMDNNFKRLFDWMPKN